MKIIRSKGKLSINFFCNGFQVFLFSTLTFSEAINIVELKNDIKRTLVSRPQNRVRCKGIIDGK